MVKKSHFLFILVLLAALIVSGCTSTPAATPVQTEAPTAIPTEAPTAVPTEAPTEAPAAAALSITGMVATPMAWSEDEVKAMDVITVESTNKSGETKSYDGVSLNTLLELAGVTAGAATLEFVADDGFAAEVPLADVQACTDCIVSFRSQGGFSTVLPGFASNLQVKGVIEIRVK